MSRGGCRLETDHSLVDYSVEQRLRQMLEQANFLGDLETGEEIPVADYVPEEVLPVIETDPIIAADHPVIATDPVIDAPVNKQPQWQHPQDPADDDV
ncbi:MAG: hypothetical protein NVV73_19710 [Cellvibrionaceae bacterium]|nr:hypothetical protein [Cellvibrionaceae bacterium]